jgi:hypothetical protein
MKFYFSFLLFILINLNLSSQIVYNWQNSKEGWTSGGNCNLTAQPVAMAMRLFAPNGLMRSGNISANLGINGTDYNLVEVTLKNPTSGSGIARLFIYPPGTNNDTCYYAFQVGTSMTGFSTYTISLDSIPTGGTSMPYDGPIARFGLRAPWGGANFDTIYWKQMIVTNTNQVIDSANITFKVDMSQVSDVFTAPELNGTFNSWCGNCNAMSDIDGDNVWDVTVKLQSGDTIEYKYSADSWAIQETNDPNGSCTNGDPNFTNRMLIVPYNDFALSEVCWGSCDSCQPLSSDISTDDLDIIIFPNPTSSFLTIQSNSLINPISIYDITGKLVLHNIGNSKEIIIDISNLNSGLYYIKSSTAYSSFKRSFIIN